ncbi:hypothetical protein EI94DRAFT_264324 [Lactarius quietus]|nr:hypothetical protein EI94DRAFT_264324 [Lactarius quietus]
MAWSNRLFSQRTRSTSIQGGCGGVPNVNRMPLSNNRSFFNLNRLHSEMRAWPLPGPRFSLPLYRQVRQLPHHQRLIVLRLYGISRIQPSNRGLFHLSLARTRTDWAGHPEVWDMRKLSRSSDRSCTISILPATLLAKQLKFLFPTPRLLGNVIDVNL